MFTKTKNLSAKERARLNKIAADSIVQIRPIKGVTYEPPSAKRKEDLTFQIRVSGTGDKSYREVCAELAQLATSGDCILHSWQGGPLYWGNIVASDLTPKW